MSQYVLTIIFAVVLLYAAISGYIKGLLAQIGQIAGLIIGILAARALAPTVLQMLIEDADAEPASVFTTVICYIFVFLAAYFSVVLIARVLKIVVRIVLLGFVDRLGGAIFKMIKWALILSLAYNLVAAISPQTAPDKDANLLDRIIYATAPKTLDMWKTS